MTEHDANFLRQLRIHAEPDTCLEPEAEPDLVLMTRPDFERLFNHLMAERRWNKTLWCAAIALSISSVIGWGVAGWLAQR